MYSSTSLVSKITKAKCTHYQKIESKVEVKKVNGEDFEQEVIFAHVRPWKRVQGLCPECKKQCPGYDTKRAEESRWRGPNLNGMPLYFCYTPKRIQCPEHGVKTEWIPWADGSSRFLPSFNDEVTYLSLTAPKTVVSEYLSINWRTVGNCIKACHNRLEPDVKVRWTNLKRICVDETSYKKGYKYITVVIDMDTNQVIWIHENHGDEVFKLFCEQLTEEQRAQITIVAGDGAKWIDRQTKAYFPNAKRCVDPFHVVSWITEALDTVRKSVAAKAKRQATKEREAYEQEAEMKRIAWMKEYEEYLSAKVELETYTGKRGRKSNRIKALETLVEHFEEEYGETMDLLAKQKKGTLTEEQEARLKELEEKAATIKGSKYVLGMNPEHLNEKYANRLEMLKVTNPDLYEAYRLKEVLRVIIHMTDRAEADKSLDAWIKEAEVCQFSSFVELAKKIKERKEQILNSIETKSNSSKSEQTNGLIKGLIKTAHGFRNLENLYALIYLRCSDIVIPLAHRYRPSKEKVREMREQANERRQKREQAKKDALAG